MTYPDYKREIAVRLLQKPIGLDIHNVAIAVQVPDQTVRNWKKKAEAGQVIDKRLRKSTKSTQGLQRAARTKNESRTTVSKDTRKCTSSNTQPHESGNEKCTYCKSIRLHEDYKN